ncbi:hypothetical protein P2P98_08580 [Microbacterium sp. Kw_RZR3]|uniref:hypothetical protein n=1 Tax=Microbacterium sp. Kw_RZR3 TaxID=3032903 RepID=UPI0023DC363E|nr:hypothetical protein [Microbacterium sp. Kw_RZR3]MDF2046212.1 hypothetical protein [Microbacterium sp. Kw_RZR3]
MARKEDNPRCERPSLDVIVTNQPGEYDRSRSHASAWVCSDVACVIDAMAWVTRYTKEPAWWRVGINGEWHNELPTAELIANGGAA